MPFYNVDIFVSPGSNNFQLLPKLETLFTISTYTSLVYRRHSDNNPLSEVIDWNLIDQSGRKNSTLETDNVNTTDYGVTQAY